MSKSVVASVEDLFFRSKIDATARHLNVPVRFTDAAGLAEFDLAAEPERVELRLDGWRVLDSHDLRDGKLIDRDYPEIWMVRE